MVMSIGLTWKTMQLDFSINLAMSLTQYFGRCYVPDYWLSSSIILHCKHISHAIITVKDFQALKRMVL